MTRHPILLQSYQNRATNPTTSPLAAYFLRLIAAKRSNLCVSADVSTTRELLQLAEEVGDSICLLKTHADIILDFGTKTMHDLQAIAKRKHFLIFEDRKFGDIGNTVQMQYTAGPLQIVRWANIVNAHIFPGPAIVTALAKAAEDAVAAYNTSVETQISGPEDIVPEPGVEEPEEPVTPDEPLITSKEAAAGSRRSQDEDEEEGDRLTSDEDDDDDDPGEPAIYSDDEDQVGDLASSSIRNQAHRMSDDPDRKFSVVSVSTTISTRTEHIAPGPTSQGPTPRSSDGPTSSASAVDATHALAALGDAPTARGLLLLAQMSSAGNLMDSAYSSACLDVARKHRDFVLGFIAQSCLNAAPEDNFITMTPGVQIGSKGDAMGQQYNTPEHVVGQLGADVVIVGRGVYAATDRRRAAEEYRERSWRAYEQRVGL